MRQWIAIFALLLCATAARGETPWPLRTPAELAALHGPTFVGMQILTYRRTQTPKVDGAAPQVVIGVGPDIIYREDGQNRLVVDLRLGRIYDVKAGHYLDTPIAPYVGFRDFELTNRLWMSQAMAKAGIDQSKVAMTDPFWRSVELKITPPNEPPPAVTTRTEGRDTVFLYRDAEVTRWRPADDALPAPVASTLARTLLWFFEVHPTFIARFAKEGRAPAHLLVHVQFPKAHTDDYELVGSQWCATCQALPADAKPGLFVGGVLENEMAPIMVAAVQGKYAPVMGEEYLRRIDAALERRATLEAFLWFIERSLQYGVRRCWPNETEDYCRIMNQLVAQARQDADVQLLTQAVSKRSMDASTALAALRSKVASNAYYIDLASVDAIPSTAIAFKPVETEPLKSAEKRMAIALAGMPVVPAVYRDIGNMYFNAVMLQHAWLVWEMGRAVPGRTAEPNLWGHMDAMEATARQRHPEFY